MRRVGVFLLVAGLASTLVMADPVSNQPHKSRAFLTIAPSFVGWDGLFGFGVTVGPMFETRPGLFFGFETGIIGAGEIFGYRGAQIYPLMGSAMYKFDTGSAVVPYIGLSAGLGIVKFTQEEPVKRSETHVYLTALLRPGVEFVLADGFGISLEPKIGYLHDKLMFAPQFGFLANF